MKTQCFRFILCSIIASLTCPNLTVAHSSVSSENGGHFCGVTEWQPDNRRHARTLSNLDVGEPRTVRIIYFLPSDSQPQPDIDSQLDALIKGAQHHYLEVMEGHGFGRKTFTFETDTHGKAVVHHIDGKFTDAYYIDDTTGKVLKEVDEQFDRSKNIYLIGIKISNYGLDSQTACGTGFYNGAVGGWALIPTSGLCFNVSVTAHELGHAFGLAHDWRTNAKVVPSPYTIDTTTTSFCAAEWLDAHRYFNTEQQGQNAFDTRVQILPLSLVSEPNTIRLRFEVTDPDGLHQVQLLTSEATYSGGLIACKRLESTNSTVEFVTAELTTKSNRVGLNVMDVHGNFIWHSFSIDILALLPPAKAISIPDANLAAAVREALNLAPDAVLTSHTMLELTHLNAPNRQITDLTGLEYAQNLKELWVGAELANDVWVSSNAISDLSPIEGLTQLYWMMLANPSSTAVSALPRLTSLRFLQIYNPSIPDASVISGLTQLEVLQIYNPSTPNVSALVSAIAELERLTVLELWNTSVSDISALAGLTQLKSLRLGHNSISDISPLAGLTQLGRLELGHNSISDISPVADLTNLTALRFEYNAIMDSSPVAGLTNLTELHLHGNSISNLSPLSGLIDLRELHLSGNAITDISSLSGLIDLRELYLTANAITDISPVSGLTHLTRLFLGSNAITDISPVAGLINLIGLQLRRNAITDISPLVAITGFGSQDWSRVYVEGNPLSYASIHTHIPTLKRRGVTVEFDNRTLATPLKISGDDQQGTPGTALERPFVVEVRDAGGSAFEGVPVTFTVTAGGGTLSGTNATTDSNGRAESTLTLGPIPGTNTVTVSVAGIQEGQTFNAEGIGVPKTLEIVSGDDQEGLPGAALDKAFVVEVRNQSDKPLPEVQVTFSVTNGGGTLSATSVTTDANGRAESRLTLGPIPGTNTVTVSVAGIQEGQTFNAEGIGVPKTLEIVSGDDQEGLPGAALDKAFVVEVRDQSGDPLPGVQVTFSVSSGGGTLSATITTTDNNGRVKSTLTLGPNPGTNTVEVAATGIHRTQSVSAIAELPPIPQDVNRDDMVNILDLVLVASVLGDEGGDLAADVNGDGVVNILDLVMVAGALGNAAAAPSVWYRDLEIAPTRAEVGQWLAQAGELGLTDATSQRGVLFLEQLFAALTPKETALLPNYPNPFNPETWIPYQLSEDAFVTLTIYDGRGRAVRTLEIGHRISGFYEDRSQAIYWDGRNDFGDGVASGVYFYHLSAGDYSATRKMLIIK